MSSIDGWLAQKYAILGKEADARDITARASAAYTNAQTGMLAGDQALKAADVAGQNQLRTAQANSTNVTASLAPGLAQSEQTLRGAQSGLYGAETGKYNAETQFMDTYNPALAAGYLQRVGGFSNPTAPAAAGAGLTPTTGGLGGSTMTRLGNSTAGVIGSTDFAAGPLTADQQKRMDALPAIQGYAKGTSKVPGKGSGKVDTVPAMLAPGEAVLNRGAAEHIGRHTIDALNAVGQAKMGMGVSPPAKGGKPASDPRSPGAGHPAKKGMGKKSKAA